MSLFNSFFEQHLQSKLALYHLMRFTILYWIRMTIKFIYHTPHYMQLAINHRQLPLKHWQLCVNCKNECKLQTTGKRCTVNMNHKNLHKGTTSKLNYSHQMGKILDTIVCIEQLDTPQCRKHEHHRTVRHTSM